MSTFTTENLTTQTGEPFVARVFEPEQEARAAVLIAPAMGVSQTYYTAFAAWLREQGYWVATFDFRGVGLSRLQPLRRVKANLIDWVQQECAIMIDLASARLPQLPLFWVGHSFGGQVLPLVPNHDRVSKMITVATGTGYWRYYAPRLKWWGPILWYVLVPLLTPVFGYFPGRHLRIISNLPAGVMYQWRRWCLNPQYALGVEGPQVQAAYANARLPIVSLSFSDDEMMSLRSIESLHALYSGTRPELRRIKPNDISVARIGHFGFFRLKFKESLWPKYILPELV